MSIANSRDLQAILHLLRQARTEKQLPISLEPTLESLLRTVTFAETINDEYSYLFRAQNTVIFVVRPLILHYRLLNGHTYPFPAFSPRTVAIAVVSICDSIWQKAPFAFMQEVFVEKTWRGMGYQELLVEHVNKVVADINAGETAHVPRILINSDCTRMGLHCMHSPKVGSLSALRALGERLSERARRAP